MAQIVLHPEVPPNIKLISSRQRRKVRECFERGEVVVLSDVRINADFRYFDRIRPMDRKDVRKGKYVFTKWNRGVPEKRSSVWSGFIGDNFPPDPAYGARFRQEVKRVESQVDRLVKGLFGRHHFSTAFIAWKFQPIVYENMHIDNLANSNHSAQVRLFVNLGTTARRWGVARHWRHYAQRYWQSAKLGDWTDDPYTFNSHLNHAAFGSNRDHCDEPRHIIDFEPGEVWLTNSALVAHQVQAGSLLCSAHYEYPYRQCLVQANTLPAQIAAMRRFMAGLPEPNEQPSLIETIKRFAQRF
ncbi:MAG TPA: hypothetical protein VIL42_04045 [Sphingomicrobium sp.]